MVVSNNKLFHCLSHDVITCDEDCDLLTAYWWSSSSNGVGYSCITIYIMAIWCDWQILIPNVPVSSGFPRGLTLSCFLAGLMLYQSPVVFLDCWYPCFRNFDSIIPVDVIRVKSSVDSYLDSSGVPLWISINKLYFVPKQVEASHVSILRNGRGLGTD